ncbi:MAG TPA: phage tail protein I [Candidatus Hydrothermia bacterium]|nr:phage tail protein I [Candidatus Hydrothermia bacterium]
MVKTKDILPVNLQGDKNIEAICEAIDKVFYTEEEIGKLLVYIIDTVDVSAFNWLAWQFHIEGWELAQTEAEKRSLIKKAIELHRYKGTIWAVKEAIKAVGYADAELEERFPPVKYDNTYTYSGTETYMGGLRWALFRVLIDIGERKSLTQTDIQKLIALINEYKNVRSHLKDISFRSTVQDRFADFIDSWFSKVLATYQDIKPWGLRYDGSIAHNQAVQNLHNGSFRYNGQKKYDEWQITGHRHDNVWDTADFSVGMAVSDEVEISARYDGRLRYSGFHYGSDAPFAVDPAMKLRITRHIRYDGRYRYSGALYDGSFRYNASRRYFEGIYYRGNIVTQEAVV